MYASYCRNLEFCRPPSEECECCFSRCLVASQSRLDFCCGRGCFLRSLCCSKWWFLQLPTVYPQVSRIWAESLLFEDFPPLWLLYLQLNYNFMHSFQLFWIPEAGDCPQVKSIRMHLSSSVALLICELTPFTVCTSSYLPLNTLVVGWSELWFKEHWPNWSSWTLLELVYSCVCVFWTQEDLWCNSQSGSTSLSWAFLWLLCVIYLENLVWIKIYELGSCFSSCALCLVLLKLCL